GYEPDQSRLNPFPPPCATFKRDPGGAKGYAVTNLDPNPELIDYNMPEQAEGLAPGFAEKYGTDYIVEVLEPRAVPLGGPRAMTVQRTIPQRARSLIGA